MRLFFLVLLLANLAVWYWRADVAAWLGPRLEPPPAPQVRGEQPPALVLLAEREGARASAGDGRPATVQPQAPARSPARNAGTAGAGATVACIELGPWEDPARVAAALDAATAAGIEPRRVSEEREVPTGYWIVSAARYDFAGARAAMDELEEKGIRDLAIVSLDDGHAVSLGVFSRASAMERRRRELTDAGYAADVRRRTQTRAVELLVIERRDGASVDAFIERLGRADPTLQWRERPCP